MRRINLNKALLDQMLAKKDKEFIKVTLKLIEERRNQCEIDYPKKWIVFAVGLTLGMVLGTVVPAGFKALNSSLYKRDSLEQIMDDYLGQNNFNTLLTDDLLVVAYDYNSQEPRFYSKFFAETDPPIYDVPVGNATGASSAAPLYFEPKT